MTLKRMVDSTVHWPQETDNKIAEKLLKGAIALASKEGLKTVSALMGDYGKVLERQIDLPGGK